MIENIFLYCVDLHNSLCQTAVSQIERGNESAHFFCLLYGFIITYNQLSIQCFTVISLLNSFIIGNNVFGNYFLLIAGEPSGGDTRGEEQQDASATSG